MAMSAKPAILAFVVAALFVAVTAEVTSRPALEPMRKLLAYPQCEATNVQCSADCNKDNLGKLCYFTNPAGRRGCLVCGTQRVATGDIKKVISDIQSQLPLKGGDVLDRLRRGNLLDRLSSGDRR